MTQPSEDEVRPVIVLVVLLLVVTNLTNNIWAPGAHLFVSPLVTVLLLGIGRAAGLSWTDIGLGRGALLGGIRWGGAGVVLITAGYALALALPFARAAAEAAPGIRTTLFNALVDVPVGTVILEEVAFRGVLWALLSRDHGPVVATAVSSVLFGLWHVLPTLGSSDGVRVPTMLADGFLGRLAWVLLNVLATGAAGVVFCELRRRSGSLLAPMLVHWALNGVGFGFRAVAGRTA